MCVHACVCSVAQSCPTLCNPRDYSPPGSSAHGIFQAECWSALPFLTPGDLPDPESEPTSLASPLLAGIDRQIILLLSHQGNMSLIPGSGRSPGVRNGNLLQYPCLENPIGGENPIDRGAWWASVYGVTKSRTRLKGLSSSSIYIWNLER